MIGSSDLVALDNSPDAPPGYRLGNHRKPKEPPLRKAAGFAARLPHAVVPALRRDYQPANAGGPLLRLLVPLKGFEVIDRGLRIIPAKAECRHVRVNGGQAIL
jgi:hypothetical protein